MIRYGEHRIPGTSRGRAVIRVLHLLPDRREKSPDPNLTGRISNEWRSRAAAVGLDGMSGAGFDLPCRRISSHQRPFRKAPGRFND